MIRFLYKHISVSALLIALTLSLIPSCTTVPISGRQQFTMIPQRNMVSIGEEQYESFLEEHEIIEDTKEAEMVKRVGQRLATAVTEYFTQAGMTEQAVNFDWEFNLIKEYTINAWCLPGGKIAVYSGILPITKTETGLSVVMAHEIAHAVAQHGNERMTQALLLQFGGIALSEALESKTQATKNLWQNIYGYGSTYGLIYPYSRRHEKEADRLGLRFMAMAGYNPEKAVDFWQRMKKEKDGSSPPALLSTHPADDQRIEHIKKYIPSVMPHYKESANND